jgi:two-component system, NarL family, nitrate/nitrite response regulator NarL
MPVSVVLADAQPVVLEGLKSVLRRAKNFRIVAQCATSEQALRAVRKHRPNILVLDIHISSRNGLDILRQMARAKLPTRSVVFTTSVNDNQTLELIRLGASGLVLKNAPPRMLIHCIRKVQAGEQSFERGSSVTALEKLMRRERAARQRYENLSHREMQIVRMVSNGLRNKQIGKRLSVTEGTVQVHLHHIYRKLNLPHRLALALYARDIGLN